MGLKWADTLDLAIALNEVHAEVDPRSVNFADLHAWVLALSDFDDDPSQPGDKMLEAIQMAWMEERE